MNKPGHRNSNTKLDWQIVRMIRKRYKEGLSLKTIARAVGCHHSTISRIVNNISWKEENDGN